MIPQERGIGVKIPSYVLNGGVAYYCLELQNGDERGQMWTLLRRFSSFDELHQQLRKSYTKVPKRPKKTIFKMKKPADLEQRKTDLENFCRLLLARQDLLQSPHLQEFFELPQHAPDSIIRVYSPVGLLKGAPVLFPVTHALIDETGHFLITAERERTEDTKAKTETAAKTPGTSLSVLRLFELEGVEVGGKAFACVQKWSVACGDKVRCIAYSSSLCHLAWGTEHGFLHIRKLLHTNDILEERPEVGVHSGRVMDVRLEESQGYVITIGEDKKVVGTSLEGKALYSARLGDHPLRCCQIDSERQHLVVGNSNGEVFICDIQSIKVNLLRAYTFLPQAPIRFLQLCQSEHLLLCCFEGNEVRWFGFDDAHEGQLVGKRQFHEKVTAVAWLIQKGVLLVANSQGQLRFVSIPTGETKLLMRCHTASISAIQANMNCGTILTSAKDASFALWKSPLE